MISLELAKKLKEAGLEWEPQIGDMFYFKTFKDWGIDAINSEDVNNNLDETRDFIEEGFWILAPRLDQLLAEIERRGYWWSIENGLAEYLCFFVKQDGKKFIKQSFWANSPEEATAQALLWILESERGTTHEV